MSAFDILTEAGYSPHDARELCASIAAAAQAGVRAAFEVAADAAIDGSKRGWPPQRTADIADSLAECALRVLVNADGWYDTVAAVKLGGVYRTCVGGIPSPLFIVTGVLRLPVAGTGARRCMVRAIDLGGEPWDELVPAEDLELVADRPD